MSFAAIAAGVASAAITAGTSAAVQSAQYNDAKRAREKQARLQQQQQQQMDQGGGGWGAPTGPQDPYSQQQRNMQSQLLLQAARPLPGTDTNQDVFKGSELGSGNTGPYKFFADGGEVDEEGVDLRDSDYIIPADVVSALGNGSTEAGARVLEAMLERIVKQGEIVRRHAQGIAGAGAQRLG